mmetsp:Transcript_18260/g.37977  ORF Transcript_18260/g.37977 Transcript_18260/m.37977 type:complete len:133 (+) Transcript_18260:321-719(+)
MENGLAENNAFKGVCELQNIDHSLQSLHYLLQFDGVRSSYEKFDPTVAEEGEDDSDDLEITVERIQAQLAKILGGSKDQYYPDVLLNNFGIDSLSTIELVNWINRYAKEKIKPGFVTESTTANTIHEHMRKH